MSKAFTKETDGDEDDEVSLPPLAKGARTTSLLQATHAFVLSCWT